MKEPIKKLSNAAGGLVQKITNTDQYQSVKKFLLAKNSEEAGFSFEKNGTIDEAIQKPIKIAFTAIGLATLFFIVWGGLAPLDQASTAQGFVMVSGNHKTIQHYEGGIVEKIAVKDGDLVQEGQLLVKLNDTRARADLQIIKSQLAFALAEQARLNSQQEQKKEIDWNFEMLKDFDPSEIENIKHTQSLILERSLSGLHGNINLLSEEILIKQDQIKGLQSQLDATRLQLQNYSTELKSSKELLAKGLAHKPRVMELQRAYEQQNGTIGNILSQISAVNQEISQNHIKIVVSENDFHKRVSDEIKENHKQLLDLFERYNQAQDSFNRTEITSPATGIVTDLQHFTVGGVIQHGQKIMDIVPNDEQLIIEAQLLTQDIDSIYVGMLAKVQFGAFKARTVPRLEGKVIYVAPDRKVDERTGQPYYLVRVLVDDSEFEKVNAEVKLQAGMPATVFVIKGSRTMLQYLLSPLLDSFHRAFKEA